MRFLLNILLHWIKFIINTSSTKRFKVGWHLPIPPQVNGEVQFGIAFPERHLSRQKSFLRETARNLGLQHQKTFRRPFQSWWDDELPLAESLFDLRYWKRGWKTTPAFLEARQRLRFHCLSRHGGYHNLVVETGKVKGPSVHVWDVWACRSV